MASHRQLRWSLEEPPAVLSLINLKDEFNKLHEECSAECQTRIKNMSKSMDEIDEAFRKIKKGATIAGATGGALMITGLALSVLTFGVSAIIAGLGAATATAAGITAAVGAFIKILQDRELKQTIETELEELQNKMSPMINLLEKMFQRTQEILGDPKIPQHKATALRHCFNDRFQKCTTFHLTGKLSGTLAEIGQMLELLDEITEDNPAKPMKEEEIKEAAEKFIKEMRKGIDELQNTMNEINQLKKRISKSLIIIDVLQ